MALLRPFGFLSTPVRTFIQAFPRVNSFAWDIQYRFGLWDYLDSETSGAELLEVVKRHSRPKPSILDLGCGKGANLPLTQATHGLYHGVDISAEAVNRARSLRRPNATYETADIVGYEPRQSYDVILLVEVIYYVAPAKIPGLLRGLSESLASEGRMFVEIWDDVENGHNIINAIRDSGLVMAEEHILPVNDNPRTVYILGSVP
jgi:2-polyprenyl-3-methyl-5-hydroxy-6-metoxy-1,4-benzoquinol methylase